MASKAGLAGAVAAAAIAVFLAARLGSSPERGTDDEIAAELRRLAAKVEHMEESLRAMREPPQPTAAQSRPPTAADAPAHGAAPEPAADSYASWTDEEICLVALSKGDDLALFKAALRRDLPAERRAKVLVALAAYRHRLERHCAAEREALIEAAGLAPATTAVGAEAALALAYSYAAHPEDRWRCDALFESVMKDAPSEEQRMKGAYGLAWRHDLGDEPPAAAAAAFREFVARWGERWSRTAEVSWARERIALHERGE
jgi:outer membrane murein-binding lipoprotein Lpp